MTFRENLVRVRKEKGLSQEELANRIGITRQSISKWETGDATPDFGNIQQLTGFLVGRTTIAKPKVIVQHPDVATVSGVNFSTRETGLPVGSASPA